MGRYITGDINRKLWFAVQSSDAPSRFGGETFEPNFISYHFNKDEHLEGVIEEIQNIEEFLGENKVKLDDFFNKNNGYTDKSLEEIGITSEMLSEYADLLLGLDIRDFLLNNSDECNFDAEL